MPFFIDWLACTNPRLTTPAGGVFNSMAIVTPQADALHNILQSIGLDIPVSAGEPAITVNVTAPAGEVVLASTDETRALSLR